LVRVAPGLFFSAIVFHGSVSQEGKPCAGRFGRIAVAITAVVVVAIAGGVTYAVAQIGGGGVINGCYKSVNGQLRLIDPATDSCRRWTSRRMSRSLSTPPTAHRSAALGARSAPEPLLRSPHRVREPMEEGSTSSATSVLRSTAPS
jgi:hypothetical protein